MHFDMECLPGHWIGGDYVSKVVTAAAWSWRGSDFVNVRTHYDCEPRFIVRALAKHIRSADIVTGHYIRGFDLPLLNGALLREGEEPLEQVLTVDTKMDLLKTHGRSQSQKNLAGLLGVPAPKVDLTLGEWEQFNLKHPDFRDRGEIRVVGDVIQHKQLYQALEDRGWLGSPKVWSSASKASGRYHA